MQYDIYVLVDENLKPGLKCAQVAHAVAGLLANSPTHSYQVWSAANSGRMIVLDRPSYVNPVNDYPWIPQYHFREPDLDNQVTASAYCVWETQRDLFQYYPLAYKKKWWQFWK